MMLLQGDVLAHVTTIINTDAYKLYSIYYILYVLCLYIIDLTVQFHCYTVIEMLLQFTVIIAKVAPSIATKTGLRESLLTYGFLDYVHGYMFFLTMGLIKHFFFFFFFFCVHRCQPPPREGGNDSQCHWQLGPGFWNGPRNMNKNYFFQ